MADEHKDKTVAILNDVDRNQQKIDQLENTLASVFASMNDGVYIVDQDYNIEFVNAVLSNIFGPYQNRKCYAYLHNRKEACPWCQNHLVFAGKTVRWQWYSEIADKTYDLVDTPVRNAVGKISKLEIFHDITEN